MLFTSGDQAVALAAQGDADGAEQLWPEALGLIIAAEQHAAPVDRPMIRINRAFVLKAAVRG